MLLCAPRILCQTVPAGAPAQAKRSTERLYMRDGSYQVVTEYHMAGVRVRYYSAERGAWEEVPTELVDIPRTQQWNREHAALPPRPAARAVVEAAPPPPPEDPAHPTVAPRLKLPDEGYLFALDVFRDTNELVPLRQDSSNPAPPPAPKQSKAEKKSIAPVAALAPKPALQSAPEAAHVARANGHEEIRLRGTDSQLRLHVADPVFYVRGAANDHAWVIVRVRQDVNRRDRVVTPISEQTLHGVGANALGFKAEALKGGQWTKLTPAGPIPIGEYAVVQVLSPGTFDAHVWDFAIDPTSNDNGDAVKPEGAERR